MKYKSRVATLIACSIGGFFLWLSSSSFVFFKTGNSKFASYNDDLIETKKTDYRLNFEELGIARFLNENMCQRDEKPINQYQIDQRTNNHVLGVVVPYRNRLPQLKALVTHLSAFLEKQDIFEVQYWIMDQQDQYRFNRGELLNIGVRMAKEAGCDYVVLHDVDLLPMNMGLSYKFPSNPGLFHVSAPGLHPKYKFKKFLGGIIKVSIEDYEKVNGFSNEFWGWGKEDDDFRRRVLAAELDINRPPNFKSGQKKTFKHIHSRQLGRDKGRTKEQNDMLFETRQYQGYNSTRYNSICVNQLMMSDQVVNIVELFLYCNPITTPWCIEGEKEEVLKKKNKKK